jgi:hypothetical protein
MPMAWYLYCPTFLIHEADGQVPLWQLELTLSNARQQLLLLTHLKPASVSHTLAASPTVAHPLSS